MKNIVVVSGKMGSGKTTLTNLLIAGFNGSAAEIRFSDLIYDMHDQCLKIMRDNGIMVPKKDGKLLQLLGTDWGRHQYGNEVWVNALKYKSENYLSKTAGNTLLVISDCRFRNEFDAFPQALRVRLGAVESVRKSRADAWRENTLHQSEIDLDGYASEGRFDLYIDTHSTPINGMVDLVRAQLDKGWLDKRKLR